MVSVRVTELREGCIVPVEEVEVWALAREVWDWSSWGWGGGQVRIMLKSGC